jgi:hypothetical protein
MVMASFVGQSAFAGPGPGGENTAGAVDPKNATWHIGLNGLWGVNAKGQPRSLNIYAVFEDGKWVNALGSATTFNKSVHLVPQADVNLDLAGNTLTGKLKVLITPDPWVPPDQQPRMLLVDLKGKLDRDASHCSLSGAYEVRREDGQPIPDRDKGGLSTLGGGAGANEIGWDNSVWRFQMNQMKDPNGFDLDALDVTLGVADGKVRWGLIGPTASPAWPATETYPFDVSGFGPVTSAGIAKGSFEVTERHIHAAGDPARAVRIDLVARRVQGMAGGEATLEFVGRKASAGEAPCPFAGGIRHAYGRGTVAKGGGEAAPRAVLWVRDLDKRPWWTPVEGFQPVAAGEHPRLLFRKSDLPALRKRAETPEGKAILARLRALLGKNGEAPPDTFNATPPDNHAKSPAMPMGTFTTWHAGAFGFLYQITGDKKYAELARLCAQFMLDGKIDVDNRYSWFKPGTDLRAGSVLAAMAYAYDFCYDAWPEDFRRKIALEIQNYSKDTCSPKEPASIARLVGRSGYPPGSNHYGSLIGGTGVALLAIRGDAGTDTQLVERRLAEAESNISRMLTLGFGDAGWFAEGFGASSSLSRAPTIELIHAMRNAEGRDYLRPRPNAEWMTLFWIMHMGGTGCGNIPNRGVYEGDNNAAREGEFALSFGAVPPKYLPALLWSYETFVGSQEPKAQLGLKEDERSWATGRRYPIFAVYSFLNWPIGVEPKNPADVLPLAAVDRIHGYFVARNRWKDSDDVIVTHWMEYGPKGYYSSKDAKGDARAGFIRVWGYGLRTAMNTRMTGAFATQYAQAKDGSFTLTAGGPPTGLAVDFSKAGGAEVVIVAVGPGAGAPAKEGAKNAKAAVQDVQLKMGDVPVHVFTMQTGPAPKVSVDGSAVLVGAQRFTWDGKVLQPATFGP